MVEVSKVIKPIGLKRIVVGGAVFAALATAYLGLEVAGIAPPKIRQGEARQEQQYTQQAAIPGIENIMSEAEVKSTLEEILSMDKRLTPDDADILKKAEDVNKSIYFMLTGKTFEQQRFETNILPREEYDKAVHQNLKGSLGTIGIGKDAPVGGWGTIYIFASLPTTNPFELVTTLAKETAQAYRVRGGPRNIDVGINPSVQDDRGGELLDALYLAAAINKMYELGVRQAATPTDKVDSISKRVDGILKSHHFFEEAWAAAWVFALENPETANNLRNTGWAGSKALMSLFYRRSLLDFRQYTPERNKEAYAQFKDELTTAIKNRQNYAGQIKYAIEKRADAEGRAFSVTSTILP